MVCAKLTHVSVNFGGKFRNNQNYTVVFNKTDHGVNENTTVEDVRKLIESHFSDQVKLNNKSIIEITGNTDKI